MIAACPQCGARTGSNRSASPRRERCLRCSRCEAIFRVSPPRAEAAAEPVREPKTQAPVAPVPPSAAAAQPARDRDAEPRRRLVLVADPDIEAGKALAGTLAGWGIEPVLVQWHAIVQAQAEGREAVK